MPAGITLLQSNNADIPSPPTGKATLFFSAELNAIAYKDSSGVVHIFGVNSLLTPPIIQFGDDGGGGSDDFLAVPSTIVQQSNIFSGDNVPSVLNVSGVLPTNSNYTIPESFEISNNVIFEIADSARLEITGVVNDIGEFLDICREGLPGGTQALSTLGTFDWFAFGSSALSGSPPRANSPTSSAFHASKNGTYIMHSFDWINNGATTFFNNQNSNITYTTAAGDDINGSAFSGSGGSGVFLVAGALYGFKFTLPASRKRRKLIIYSSYFSADVNITATLKGSGTQKVHFVKGASGAANDVYVRITFESDATQDLEIQCQLTVVLGTNQSANAKLMYAWAADA